MAGALKEMQSEGKADQVFHPISASNGSILQREEDYQPVIIKVTSTICWIYFYFSVRYIFYLSCVYMNMKVVYMLDEILLM